MLRFIKIKPNCFDGVIFSSYNFDNYNYINYEFVLGLAIWRTIMTT